MLLDFHFGKGNGKTSLSPPYETPSPDDVTSTTFLHQGGRLQLHVPDWHGLGVIRRGPSKSFDFRQGQARVRLSVRAVELHHPWSCHWDHSGGQETASAAPGLLLLDRDGGRPHLRLRDRLWPPDKRPQGFERSAGETEDAWGEPVIGPPTVSSEFLVWPWVSSSEGSSREACIPCHKLSVKGPIEQCTACSALPSRPLGVSHS